VKVPGTPHGKSVLFWFLLEVEFIKTICAHSQPNHVENLLSGLSDLLKATFIY
jgi:hypothetical protein